MCVHELQGVMTTLMRNGRDRRSGKPGLGHARKERVLLIGTRSADYIRASSQSGCIQRPDTWLHPNASLKCQIPLAPRAPFIHDPNVWTRRALQEKSVRLGCAVLHQCIRPHVGAYAPGHHGNPRAPELISGYAWKGNLGHQFSDALERPFLHLLFSLSQTSVGKRFRGSHRVSNDTERVGRLTRLGARASSV